VASTLKDLGAEVTASTDMREYLGDAFISGFELGAEFVSVINIDVVDKSETPAIQGYLESIFGFIRSGNLPDPIQLEGIRKTTIFIRSSYGRIEEQQEGTYI
jgi:hypothetical protein